MQKLSLIGIATSDSIIRQMFLQKPDAINLFRSEMWQCQHQYLSSFSSYMQNMQLPNLNSAYLRFMTWIYMKIHFTFSRHWNIQGIFRALWYCRQHGWLNVLFVGTMIYIYVTFQARSPQNFVKIIHIQKCSTFKISSSSK